MLEIIARENPKGLIEEKNFWSFFNSIKSPEIITVHTVADTVPEFGLERLVPPGKIYVFYVQPHDVTVTYTSTSIIDSLSNKPKRRSVVRIQGPCLGVEAVKKLILDKEKNYSKSVRHLDNNS